jgi:hypothetical protein
MGSYPEPDWSSPYHHFFKIYLNTIIPDMRISPKWFLLFRFSDYELCRPTYLPAHVCSIPHSLHLPVFILWWTKLVARNNVNSVRLRLKYKLLQSAECHRYMILILSCVTMGSAVGVFHKIQVHSRSVRFHKDNKNKLTLVNIAHIICSYM